MDPILTARHVRKSFHHIPVLRDISLTLNGGEIVLLFGRNGCGKTTLLRILSGIMRPEGGEATLCGNSMFSAKGAWRKRMIYMGHQSNLYPEFSARENLQLSQKLRGDKWSEQAFLDLMARYELAERVDDPIQVYSQGMLQRLSLVRLSMASWSVAYMDEPSSALDVDGATMLGQTLHEWKRDGRTVLFTSHDMSWGASHTGRAIHMQNGIMGEEIIKPAESDLLQLTAGVR